MASSGWMKKPRSTCLLASWMKTPGSPRAAAGRRCYYGYERALAAEEPGGAVCFVDEKVPPLREDLSLFI
jgi:hypothetical protein